MVVSRESADPGISGTIPVAVDKDHINICKPKDKNDKVYLGLKRHIQNLLDKIISNQCDTSVTRIGADYTKKTDRDRRDLLQKLIDADREHEYEFANEAQNSFARGYLKTGLLTAARNDHDTLLSEIETRFINHIYHPLICHGASDREIRDALQRDVFDPIIAMTIGNTKFSSRIVMNALYFLTEQCHIKWDYTK